MSDPLPLHPEHLSDLRKSGLTDSMIQMMGVTSVRPSELNKMAGWDITARGVTSAMLFPYPDCDGFYQVKVFPPFESPDGHTVRYLQLPDTESRAYILPDVRERLADPAESAIITEGVKKCARLVQEGFNAVALGAVWNWKRGGDSVPFTDPAGVIPDLKQCGGPGRRDYICFDSDVWRRDRENSRLAIYALGKHLERLGAIVRVVRLPGPPKEENAAGITKIGVDDFLQRHSVEEFRKLLLAAVPLTHKCLATAAEAWRKKEEACRPFAEPISALLNEPDESPDWLVDRLLARGDCGFIAAEPKMFKSWFLYQMALCLTAKQPFLGFLVSERRRVLLMSEEDSRRRLRKRLRQLAAGLGIPAPEDDWLRFTVRTGFKLDVKEWLDRLRAELQMFRPDVVLLDVLRRVHDQDENSNRDMGKLTNSLNDLRREFGGGFFIAHHNRKLVQGTARRGRGGQEMSGAGVLHSWSEAALYLTKGSGKGKVIVTPEHKDAPELEPFVVLLEEVEGQKGVRLVNDGPATVDKGAMTRQQILEALSPTNGRTVQDLARTLNLHENTVRVHLKALEADGAVVHKKGDVSQAFVWFASS